MPIPHMPFPAHPTVHELRVARALASRDRARILCGAFKPAGFLVTDGHGWTSDPGPSADTIRNLLQRGWIKVGRGFGGRTEYFLTDAGRAAVKAVSH